jgi:hypothetical protein
MKEAHYRYAILPYILKTWSEYKDLNLGRLVPNQVCYRTTLYSDKNLVDRERIELSISGCKPDVFPLALTAQILESSDIAHRHLQPLD